jgi:hypothetical protein
MSQKAKQNWKKQVYCWHRRLGVFSAVILIVISVTGVVLNHNSSLGLDNKFTQNSMLLKRYGLEPSGEIVTYLLNENIISYMEGAIFQNGEVIGDSETVIGVESMGRFWLSATSSTIQMWSRDNKAIELLKSESLPPSSITRMGKVENILIVETESGELYEADQNLLSWKMVTPGEQEVLWSEKINTPEEIKEKILENYRGQGLTLYHVILDLHTGRFFGSWATLVYDLAAIALILLSISGLYIWKKWK